MNAVRGDSLNQSEYFFVFVAIVLVVDGVKSHVQDNGLFSEFSDASA